MSGSFGVPSVLVLKPISVSIRKRVYNDMIEKHVSAFGIWDFNLALRPGVLVQKYTNAQTKIARVGPS